MFWLAQAPYTSKHITSNKGATMKASRKKFRTNMEFFLEKGHLLPKNGGTIKKAYP